MAKAEDRRFVVMVGSGYGERICVWKFGRYIHHSWRAVRQTVKRMEGGGFPRKTHIFELVPAPEEK